MNETDAELIEQCLSGQAAAFGQLVQRHQNRLFNSLYRMLGSREDADDVAQEAFVAAFQKLDTFRGDSQFYSWLFRIAYNTAISMKRKTKLKTVSADKLKETSGHEPDDNTPEHRPEHGIEVEETQAAVQQALNELSDEYREAIVLKEMEELSYEEIAELAEVPIGTIRSRLHRARAELREKLRLILEETP
ncbi:MAG: sigma-70 family RNA polymerase sigma factor [Planctomycetaceae bacterium]|nr:sigma-70 family RNA polymerase sigma factor [Planctomycetaceae bacterium]